MQTTSHERSPLIWSLGTTLAAVAVMAGGWVVAWQAQLRLTPEPLTPASAPAPKPPVDGAAFVRGKQLFASCALCHGADGRGLPKLGKDLTASYFVSTLTDGELVAFIKQGRDAADPKNTTKIPMPPKGGNTALTDEHLADVAVYLRGLQNPERIPSNLPTVKVEVPVVATGPAPTGATKEETEWIASGMKVFNSTCIACHGAGGLGIKGNGKALAGNPFIAGLNDDDLLAFIKKGRDPGDAKNTTGVAMPPKGGNPALSDDDLLDVIAYLRALQGSGSRSVAEK